MAFLKNKQLIYEVVMIFLAALSVATIWNQTQYNSYIVWITWAIFFIDFVYRLYHSENKWHFVKQNPVLLIAIIPLDAIFQLARFARLLHLLRLKTITKYYTMPFIQFLKRQHLWIVISITSLIIFLAISSLYFVESELTVYRQALISGLMSLVFFGKPYFEPVTTLGHIIIVFLTILGVVIHGIIISTTFDLIYQSKWFQSLKQKVHRNKVE